MVESASIVCTFASKTSLRKAEIELNETKENVEKCLQELKEIVVKRGSTSSNNENNLLVKNKFESADKDVFLMYLRASKFNMTRAYSIMEANVSYRIKYPKITRTVTTEYIRDKIINGTPGILPNRNKRGEVVLFFMIKNWDPVTYPFYEAAEVILSVLEELIKSPETQINGICLIENFKKYTMKQVLSARLSDYKMFIDLLQGSFPCRFRSLHVINQPSIFTPVFNIIKPFLRSKFLNRIHLHGEDKTDFYKEFPKSELCQELGGDVPYKGEEIATILFPK